MPSFLHPRSSGLAIIIVGVAFFIMGIDRRHNGGSSAFMFIGICFIAIGARRMRRVAPPSGNA